MKLTHQMYIDPIPHASIVNRRSTRFLGETQTCKIEEISTQSLGGLNWLYGWLKHLADFRFKNLDEASRTRIETLLTEENLVLATRAAQELTPKDAAPDHLNILIHDLRGTALQQLITIADFQHVGQSPPGAYNTIAILAHDHAKIMRHSVIGLDEPMRLLDADYRLHGVVNLEKRFPSMILQNAAGKVHIDFSSSWLGDFAASCAEFSTVLKIIYNFIDNASRHTDNGLVLIRVYPNNPLEPSAVRFVIGNSIPESDRVAMTEQGENQMWRGYTTTGSGLGLSGAAGLVSEAFGLDTPQRAVDLGYVGSEITAEGFFAWIHWPTVPQIIHPESTSAKSLELN